MPLFLVVSESIRNHTNVVSSASLVDIFWISFCQTLKKNHGTRHVCFSASSTSLEYIFRASFCQTLKKDEDDDRMESLFLLVSKKHSEKQNVSFSASSEDIFWISGCWRIKNDKCFPLQTHRTL